MRRIVLSSAFIAAMAGIGCSLLVSYDGYGDGVRADDGGGGTDGTTTADGDTTNEGGGGDSSTEDGGADATIDALDGGPDGTTSKKYALVLLGGATYNDAGLSVSTADVEMAMINADGTLGPWTTTTAMPAAEDETGAAAWGSSVFIMDDWGAAAAVALPDGGLSTWSTIANVNRNSPRMDAVDGRLYVGSGTTPGGGAAPEVYYATITGPQSIGTWTPTASLATIDGGARNDSTMVHFAKTLYLVGGDNADIDSNSVLSAPIQATGALGPWVENTPMPFIGDHTRTVVVQNHLTMFGGSFNATNDRQIITSLPGDGGVLGAWQNGPLHPAVEEPAFATHAGYVYLVSGKSSATVDSTTVYYAQIDASGLPLLWQTTTTVKMARHAAIAVVVEVP